MKQYRFEIVRRTNNRYSWLFVKVKDGRHRVLASSARDYGSRRKAMKAIAAWKKAVPGADVFDVYGPTERPPFTASASNFQLVSGVLPLIVEESPIEYHSAAVRRRERKRPDELAKAAVSPAQPTAQPEVVETVGEPPAAPAGERPRDGDGGQQSS
jgi:uncharacterized protein YegP (UPF0339 family)